MRKFSENSNSLWTSAPPIEAINAYSPHPLASHSISVQKTISAYTMGTSCFGPPALDTTHKQQQQSTILYEDIFQNVELKKIVAYDPVQQQR